MATLLFLFTLLLLSHLSESQSFIGINYGEVADNLPAPEATAKLLQSTSIEKVRLYGSDPAVIKALANTNVGIMVGVPNGDIPAMATDPNFAGNWVSSNVLPFYPASRIIHINIGNEVLLSGDQNLMSQLLPAMQNLQAALGAVSLSGKIKVSTVHAMAVLTQSDPPSSGMFNPGFGDLMRGLLEFNKETGSPFVINPYPFFAFQSDPRPETLAFCLFQPNSGRVDSGTKIKYTNMFDAQVDAVRSALNKMGFEEVEIVVAETGWPYKGDSNEVGPSLDNAKAYSSNLISHLRSMVGTPLMPGKSIDTYLFALYDEELKFGPGSERSFGLFKLEISPTYDAGLSKTASQVPSTPAGTDLLLSAVAHGGRVLSYFVEQLAKAWLIDERNLSRFQKVSAWCEIAGNFGSVGLKVRELWRSYWRIGEEEACLAAAVRMSEMREVGCGKQRKRLRKVRKKKAMKLMSVVQDLADGLMAVADILDGRGRLPQLLLSSAGLLSTIISTHKSQNLDFLLMF